MKTVNTLVLCVFLGLLLPVGIAKAGLIPQPTCPVNVGKNRVLNLDQSDVTVLGGYHKETVEDCIAGCCQQEWKLEGEELKGHCNLVTFYQQEDEGIMNCFMVQCRQCAFSHQEDFSFAWVHNPLHPDNNDQLAFEALNAFPSHNALPSSLSLNQMKQSSYTSVLSSTYISLLDMIKHAINWSRESVSSSMERVRRRVSRREDAPKAQTTNAVEKAVATQAPSSNSKTEPAVSESQPSAATTPKHSGILQTSVKVIESANSSTTTEPVDLIIVDDTVTITAEKETPSPEVNPDVTKGESSVATPSKDQVSSTTDEKAQSTTDASEEVKSTTSKSPTQTEANPQTKSTTKFNSTPDTSSTPKPEETSKTESTSKFIVTTPKLESSTSSTPVTVPSQGSSTSTQGSSTVSSTPDETSTPTLETTPKQEPVSQEKTTSAKQQSTPNSLSDVVPSESSSEFLTDTQTMSRTDTYVTEEMVTVSMASDVSKDTAFIFTFETNNFVLILSLVLGVVLVSVVAVVLGRRWYEAYQRRHYNKVDYLINGS